MRNLILITIVLSIISCKKEPAQFTISGTLKNGAGKTIYLDELTNTEIAPYDSAIIDKEGKFVFKGKIDQPLFYLLRLDNNSYIYLLVDSVDNIEITADVNDMQNTYSITGSETSIILKELTDGINKSMKRIDSLRIIYTNSIQDTNHYAQIKASIDSAYFIILNNHKEFTKKFIDKYPSSLACIMALQHNLGRNPVMLPYENLEYFTRTDSLLLKKYPNSKHAQAFHTLMIRVKEKLNLQKQHEQNTIIGAIAPDISLPTPEGKTLSLSSLRGSYVLVDFWAAWCKPCRMENPILVENYKKYHSKGFDIFQVSLDKDKTMWIEGIKTDKLTWHHVSDLQYWQSAPARLYNITNIPANFLLDKEGRIIARDLRGPALGNKLKEIFGF